MSKLESHNGHGFRHRAFSVFLFDEEGRLFIQKRSAHKRLWPGFWSNSCCSHPRWEEPIKQAAIRRVFEELGTQVEELTFVYKFEYQASFGAAGSEWELCHVFLGRVKSISGVNPEEIEAVQWCSSQELDDQILAMPEMFTPWFKMEWQHLNKVHSILLKAFCEAQTSPCS